jgi:YVTN family beta-propeller protein
MRQKKYLLLVLALLVLVAEVGTVGATSTVYAYVANFGSNTTSVINTTTNIVSSTVTVGVNPIGIAVNPTGTYAYATNYGNSSVSVINASTNTVSATVTVGANPVGIAVNPSGTYAYVANRGSNSVSVINTITNTVSATVTVGVNPYGISVNPTGTYAYTANYGSNSVSVINTTTNTVSATVTVGVNPIGIAVNPSGTYAYAANYGNNSVSVINASTNTVSATINVGTNPYGVAINPTGTYAYVVNRGNSSVSVINTTTNTVSATVTVGVNPAGIAVNPSGTYAYATSNGNNSVSVINTTTNTVSATVTVGVNPVGIAVFYIPISPVATFTANTTFGVAPLAIQFNDTSTNAPTAWNYTFGDGAYSIIQNATHTYTTAGNYSVSLTSSNIAGSNTSTQTTWVNVTPPVPVASYSAAPVSPQVAPATVSFNDTSTNAPISWHWQVNGGAVLVTQNITAIFSTAGTYWVNHTASNSGGTSVWDNATYTVTAPFLTGGFSGTPLSGAVPLSVTFTDTSTNATGWNYTFGDGNSSTSQNPVFTYNIPGIYTVVQTVTNTYGSNPNVTTRTNYINVSSSSSSLLAMFIPNTPVSVTTQQVIAFWDQSTGSPTSYVWNFGDGTGISGLANVSHFWGGIGNYHVNETVCAGSTCSSNYTWILVYAPQGGY